MICTKHCQVESFAEEMKVVGDGKPFSKTSHLKMLSVGVNSEGILVLRRRIDAADVSTIVKQPVLLDPFHPYTKLLIKWLDELSRHNDQERVTDANKEMKLAMKEWNDDNFRRSVARHGIEWHVNPKVAPHMGAPEWLYQKDHDVTIKMPSPKK